MRKLNAVSRAKYLLTGLFMAMLILMMLPVTAHAKTVAWNINYYNQANKTVQKYRLNHQIFFDGRLDKYPSSKYKITGIRVANPKILSAKAGKSEYGNKYGVCLDVTVKRAGRTTITYKVKEKAGRKRTYSYKVKVRAYKYQNGLASLKIGKKQLAPLFKEADTATYSRPGKAITGKLSVKAKKGWKIDTILYYNGGKDGFVKNGAKINVKAGKLGSLFIHMTEKKTGMNHYYFIILET